MTQNIKQFSSYIILFALLITKIGIGQVVSPSEKSQKPNIIFILTDDLGYGDVGVFFQNQRREENDKSKAWMYTPNLDKMASEGAILTQHYAAAPVCAPSRASLLLGQSQGHANVRDNQFDKALEDNYTVGNVMQMLGYQTIAIGKWGLQGKPELESQPYHWPASPLNRGFDTFFGYTRHKDGHEHYPEEGLYDGKKEVYENNQVKTSGFEKCYTGDLWTAKAKQYIIDHHKGKEKDKPFFMYLAYDTPHAVLELPTQAYPYGYGLHGGIKWLGSEGKMINTATGVPDTWMDPIYANATYDDDNNPKTPEVSWPDVYKRYATITKRIDHQIQDILQLLKDLGIDKETLVVFTSDNGPSKESYIKNEPYKPNFFESFGPYDGIKRDVWEGGVKEPTIVYWPGTIKEGTIINDASISYDWMSTFTDITGFDTPVRSDGTSLLPSLTGEGNQKKSNIYIEYFHKGKTPNYPEFEPMHRDRLRKQMQMIRLGDTVAIRYNIQSSKDDFEIYNIKEDPKQAHDLNKTFDLKELQKDLKVKVLQMRIPNASAPRPYDIERVPSNSAKPTEKGWQVVKYNNNAPWISNPSDLAFEKSLTTNLDGFRTNSIMFEGYLKVPEDGNYTFNLQASGKAFLRIHDIALIDEDYDYTGEIKNEKIRLAKGYHKIKLYFKKVAGKHPEIKLSWSKTGNKLEEVSLSVFN